MSKPKALTSKGIMLFKDYELLFDFISDEDLGKVIRLLLKNFNNGKLKKQNKFENKNIEKVYTYVANRIFDYLKKAEKASLDGIRGGNPTLKGRVKGEVKGTLNGGVNLKEGNIKEGNGNKSLSSESVREGEIPDIIKNDKHIHNARAYWKSLSEDEQKYFWIEQDRMDKNKRLKEDKAKLARLREKDNREEIDKPLKEQWTKESAIKFIQNMIKFQGESKAMNSSMVINLIKEFEINLNNKK